MAKANASNPPATRLAVMRGAVTRQKVRAGGQPRFMAASSSVTLVCWNPAIALRTIYGSRRTL